MFKMKENYNKTDFIFAIVLYLAYFIMLSLFGIFFDDFPIAEIFGIQFKPTAWIMYILVIVFLIIRKQKLKSIGITKENFKQSVLLGVLVGVVFLVIALVQAYVSYSSFKGWNFLGYGLFYYLLDVGFIVEIVFRGFF